MVPGHLYRKTHFNSDAKIADEGHPQGVPLPIVFSRRYALGRAPTRGAPTGLSSLGGMPWGGHPQGAPLRLSSLGGMPWGGHPQGVPLPIVFSRRYALGRGTHKGCPYRLSSLGGMPWGGHHKGRPYRLSSLGGMPWGGHPQGVPLPIVFSRRYALGRAPTRGALLPIVFSRRYALGRAPTRGAPTDCRLSAVCPGEGTHKGCPYLGGMPGEGTTRGAPTSAVCPGEGTYLGGMPWGGHPQGVPLPIVVSRRYAWGGHPQGGAPTDCLLSAVCPGEGTHKGRPYRLSSLGVMPWGGHPQGVPLPIVFYSPFFTSLKCRLGGPYHGSRLPSQLLEAVDSSNSIWFAAPSWHFLTWPVLPRSSCYAGLIATEIW